MAKNMTQQWYHQRTWAALIIVGALIGCYIVASLAIDSGSLILYAVAIGLLILAINRFAHIIIVSVRKKAV
jgi:hypothetical protein